MAGSSPCDEAKEWLKGVSKDGVRNISDVWIQLKPWVSGNEASCLKSLLNETKDDDESNDKLSDVLKKYVFKEVTEPGNKKKKNKKKKSCSSRRPANRGGQMRNKNKMNNKNVGRQTPRNFRNGNVSKIGKEVTQKMNPDQKV